jgi:hypothetical protein
MSKQASSQASETVSRILTESVISVAQACDQIAEVTGQRPDRSTIHRWIKNGVGGTRLDAVRVGSATLTSSQAITRFITARTAAMDL